MNPSRTNSSSGTPLLCDRRSMDQTAPEPALCEAIHYAIVWKPFFLLPRDGMEAGADEIIREGAPRRLYETGVRVLGMNMQHECQHITRTRPPVRTPQDASVYSQPPDEPQGARIIPMDHLRHPRPGGSRTTNRCVKPLSDALQGHPRLQTDSGMTGVEAHRDATPLLR